MSAFGHRKFKKKVAEESNSDILFFEKLKNLIFQVLEKGEYVESKLKKKVNYLYFKNIIFNSQDYSPIIVKENNDCLFQKIAAVYNQCRLVKSLGAKQID